MKYKFILLLFSLLFLGGCSRYPSVSILPFSLSDMAIEKGEYQVTIDETHFCIHVGKLFFFSDSNTLQVNQYATHYLYNDGNSSHLFFEIGVLQDSAFLIYENPTVTNNGTRLLNVNYNREYSSTNDNLKAFKSPTVTNNGTLFYQRGIYAKNTFVSSRNVNEIVLKKNTGYIIIYKSLSNSNRIDTIVTFYNYPCMVE